MSESSPKPRRSFRLKDWHVHREGALEVGPFDLDLESGTICTLMGASGVGKTTTLLTAMGYGERGLTVSGRRHQNGHLLRTRERVEDALYIPQTVPFNPNWEVASYLGRLPWKPRSARDRLFPRNKARMSRVMAVLDEVGLGGRAQATVRELSGGETQRAALAQFLLMQPGLVVADEFVSALDPGTREWTLWRLRNMIREQGAIGLLALHDIDAALQVSDRLLLLWPHRIGMRPTQLERGPDLRRERVRAQLSLARFALNTADPDQFRGFIRHAQDLYLSDSESRAPAGVKVFRGGGSVDAEESLTEALKPLLQGLRLSELRVAAVTHKTQGFIAVCTRPATLEPSALLYAEDAAALKAAAPLRPIGFRSSD